MKKLIVLLLVFLSVGAYAQKVEKDLTYYYYYANQDKYFNNYLNARRVFDSKKFDFTLPSSKEALEELQDNQNKILKNANSYATFLNKYGMKGAGEYAELWFNQMETLKIFIKKNPEFYQLSAKERQNIIDKWYFSEVAAK
ncbi:hypothetical protein [Pedobacter arcticus]|uniref:hypothetical protein n=1 Tax=Pedobacter arcticus TaxID=752140 RepID=UPI00030E2C91|nr:hypothetical protein [Pedobacter arcticus]